VAAFQRSAAWVEAGVASKDDAVTGWGTPDAAKLLPDLVAAVNGH
jgi:hypothetical protein